MICCDDALLFILILIFDHNYTYKENDFSFSFMTTRSLLLPLFLFAIWSARVALKRDGTDLTPSVALTNSREVK